MIDLYATKSPGVAGPGVRHFAVTPSDSTNFTIPPRALYVLTAGHLSVWDGETSLTYPVTAGQILPFRAVRVNSTGTTATCVGWY